MQVWHTLPTDLIFTSGVFPISSSWWFSCLMQKWSGNDVAVPWAIDVPSGLTFFSSWTFFCSHLTAQRALNTSQDFQWASVAMCLQISKSHTMSEICSIYRYYHWHKIQTLKSSQFFCRGMRSFWAAKLLLHFKYWICDCRSAFFITLNLKRYPGSCFRRFPTYLYVHRYLGKIPHWK